MVRRGLNAASFLEWLKTVGNVFMDAPDDCFRLVLKHGRSEGVSFKVWDSANGAGNISVSFVDDAERKRLLPVLRTVLQKSWLVLVLPVLRSGMPNGRTSCK